MAISSEATASYRAIDLRTVSKIPQWGLIDSDVQEAIEVVGHVLPFRTNHYVVDNLIDWSRVPDDPIFQLVFPQQAMIEPSDYARVRDLLRNDAASDTLANATNQIRLALNPHPAGQLTHNVPTLDGRRLQGLQHKYRETVLFFPSPG